MQGLAGVMEGKGGEGKRKEIFKDEVEMVMVVVVVQLLLLPISRW